MTETASKIPYNPLGIRRTLWAQARRLERLAKRQMEDFNGR